MDGRVARGRRAGHRDVGRRGPGARRARARAAPRRVGAARRALPEDRFFGLEASLADFVAALRTGRPPAGECHDNVQSLAMCHAAVESAATGERVPVAAFA